VPAGGAVKWKYQFPPFETISERTTMSTPAAPSHDAPTTADEHPMDVTESVVHSMPYVLPLAGAVLMFLLAFIAVVMA
jgi:hypothetical protein